MSPPNDQQQPLRLLPAPRPTTLDMLFRMFGTVLIPLEAVRTELFRNLNEDRFGRVVSTKRLPLPVTTIEDSNKAMRYIEIHHLAAHIDQRAGQADDALAKVLGKEQED
ncbi:pyocin activator PrtN family protein [Ectopseudomonas toyotomiensis]|uniref:pyocin activator PrtN family protein n=1 Tax=Ectopseudomonas toyotomiensis TaxID=554344 RepID=UPI003D0F20FF